MVTLEFIQPMSELGDEFQNLAARLIEYNENKPNTEPAQVTVLIEGISQLFAITSKLEQQPSARAEIQTGDITQIGEFGFNLFSELLDLPVAKQNRKIKTQVHVFVNSLTHWILTQNGSIQSLGIVVDSIAYFANQTQDPEALYEITEMMENISLHCDPQLFTNLQQRSLSNPWRVLLLNCAITATRSHDIKLMRRCFNRLIETLPEEAHQFFTQGMQQMNKFDYPPEVKSLVQEYFDLYARPKMN